MFFRYNFCVICITLLSYSYLKSQDGYYKEQYDVFDWERIETKNTEVYYTVGNEKIAEFAAQNSERALQFIKWKLNLPSIDKLELFIYGSHNEFLQTNLTESLLSEGIAGFTENRHSRIALPFNGDYTDFKKTIYHEVVHAYLNKYFEDQASFLYSRQYLPLWLNEGIAEYYSKDGGMDFETDMYMRSYLYGSTNPKADDLYGFPAYRYGEAFCHWASEHFGKDKIELLIKEYAISSRINNKYYNVFNLGYETLDRFFQDELRKLYSKESEMFQTPESFANIFKRKKNKVSSIYTSNPSISPDGLYTAYYGNDHGNIGLYLCKTELEKDSEKLLDGWYTMGFQELTVGGNTLTWHPTEQKIAFVAKRNGFDDIYIYDIVSDDYVILPLSLRLVQSISWSPDGSKIAIAAINNNQQDIFCYTIDSRKTTQVTNDIYFDEKPVWTSDSKQVYYISRRESLGRENIKSTHFEEYKLCGIFKIDITTKHSVQLVSPQLINIKKIAKSNDDSVLYVLHDGNGIYNIYRYSLNFDKVFPITNTRYAIQDISVDAKEKKIVFTALNGSNIDLFSLNDPKEIRLKHDTLPYTRFKKHKIDPIRYKLFGVDSSKSNENETKNSTHNIMSNVNKADSMNMRLLERYPMVKEAMFSNVFRFDSKSASLGYNDFAFAPTINGTIAYADLIRNNSISVGATLSNYHFSREDLISGFMYKLGVQYEMKKHIIDYTFSLYTEGYSYPNNYTETGIMSDAEYVLNRKEKIELSLLIARAANDSAALFTSPYIAYTYNTLEAGRFASSGNYLRTSLRLSPAIGTHGANFGIFNLKARTNYAFTRNFSIGASFDLGTSFGSSPPPFRVGGTQGWLGTQSGIVHGEIYTSLQDLAFHQRRFVRGFDINQIQGSNFSTGSVYCKFPFISPINLILYPFFSVLREVSYTPYTIFFDIGTAFEAVNQISVRPEYNSGTVLQSLGVSSEFDIFGYDLRLEYVKPIINGESLSGRLCLSYGSYF